MHMSMNKGILIELERDTDNTRRLLANLQDEHLSYRPHPKSMTLGELASHIVELHNWVKVALPNDFFDFHTMYQPFKTSSVQEISDALENGYAANVTAIEGISQEDWSSTWTLQAGNHIIASVPKIAAYRFIIQNHLVHHRGQLTVYMRMLDIPLPGLYGPSADEK
jgi:uncharacterized damage-inducible protein DinB